MQTKETRAGHPDVDVYPVGALAHLLAGWRCLTIPTKDWSEPVTLSWRVSRVLAELGSIRRTAVRQIKARKWRDLKNTFNGYLAEPYDFPARMTRCGSGWTRAGAMRSLRRHGWPG